MLQITDPKIQQLLQVAQEASAAIMQSYKKPLQITEKADHSPVTNADMASHRILAAALPGIIDIPVLSEEGEHTLEELAKWEMFWVIDPIDGTKGFINETDDFAINIGIISKGQPVLGMIYIPISDAAYCAVQGGGAFKWQEQEWRPIEVAADAATAKIKVIASRHSPSIRTEELCGGIGEYDYQSRGSAIKFAVMAEGGAHLYPRFGQSCWWDTAAGQCLVEEAGGAVLDAKLQPLRYEVGQGVAANAKLLNPNFIACAYQDESWTPAWIKINKENP